MEKKKVIETVKCETCNKKVKIVCNDGVCVKCHGSKERFIQCLIRHELLGATQCGILKIVDDKPIMVTVDTDYWYWIDNVSQYITSRIKEYIKK